MRNLSQSPQPTAACPGEKQITMHRAAIEWVQTKFALKSQSSKTSKAYRETLASLDLFLQSRGLALDSSPRETALAIQQWVRMSKTGRTISTGTINQRYAIISSYYTFAITFGACESNPVDYCERPGRIIQDAAPALDKDYIENQLALIETTTREGRRDYALLTLAFMTGRRLSELTGLQWQHIRLFGKNMRVTWARCKGGKVLQDTLSSATAAVLLTFLRAEYGPNLETITPNSYVFQSHSNRNRGGRLSAQAVSTICLSRLGFSKVHVTRHSFAVNSEQAGASLSEIGDQLGHSNYQITADYLKRKRPHVYTHASKLESMFGIGQKMQETPRE